MFVQELRYCAYLPQTMVRIYSPTPSPPLPVATEDMCAEWMSANTCYDLIPPSTKIVVFDTRLRVRKSLLPKLVY